MDLIFTKFMAVCTRRRLGSAVGLRFGDLVALGDAFLNAGEGLVELAHAARGHLGVHEVEELAILVAVDDIALLKRLGRNYDGKNSQLNEKAPCLLTELVEVHQLGHS